MQKDSQSWGSYPVHRLSHAVRRALGRALFRRTIRRNGDARVLVLFHIFYPHAIPLAAQYLANLAPYRWRLCATIVAGPDAEKARDALLAIKPDADIRILEESRGFDVGPFFDSLRRVDLSAYDVVLKLHTKGGSHWIVYAYGRVFWGLHWFRLLWESTVGAFQVHRNIDLLRRGNGPVLVAAKNLVARDLPAKEALVQERIAARGLSLPSGYRFVAGTCFAVRADALAPMQRLGLTLADFPPTKRGEFTFAHAMERYLTASLSDGDGIRGNSACAVSEAFRSFLSVLYHRICGIRIIENPSIAVSPGFCTSYLEQAMIVSYGVSERTIGSLRLRKDGRLVPLAECDETTGGSDSDAERTGDRFLVVVDPDGAILDGRDRAVRAFRRLGAEGRLPVLRIVPLRSLLRIPRRG